MFVFVTYVIICQFVTNAQAVQSSHSELLLLLIHAQWIYWWYACRKNMHHMSGKMTSDNIIIRAAASFFLVTMPRNSVAEKWLLMLLQLVNVFFFFLWWGSQLKPKSWFSSARLSKRTDCRNPAGDQIFFYIVCVVLCKQDILSSLVDYSHFGSVRHLVLVHTDVPYWRSKTAHSALRNQ